MLQIYQEQLGSMGAITRPYNYMPDDIVYRLPWWMGDDEPPQKILYPILYKVGDIETIDPLTIYIGHTPSKKIFGYNPRYIVNPLMLIVGTPGAGKSATLKTIIYNFIRNEYFSEGGRVPPIIVVDPEGEYSVLRQLLNPNDVLHLKLGRRDYINIFDRPTKTIDPRVWYMRMLAVIQKFLYLSPAQAVQAYRVLKRAILKLAEKKGFTGDPATWIHDDITLEDVYNYIVTLIKTIEKTKKPSIEEKKLLSGAETLLSRLDMWMQPPNDAFSRKSTVNLSKIFKYKLIILDARGLSKDLFGMFTYWITYWIYGLMLEKGPLPSFGIRVVLIIDEAWALLRKTSKKEEENPLEAMARRGRKYGIMIIVATQTPEDVDKKMFSLFGTLVTGIIPSAEMRKKIVESRGMPKRFEEVIGRLEQGQLVWHINWRRRNFPMSGMPIIVKVDYPLKDKPLKRVVFA